MPFRDRALAATVRSNAGRRAAVRGAATVAREMALPKTFVRYHYRKRVNPGWKAGAVGGVRRSKFGRRTARARAFVAVLAQRNPLRTYRQYCEILARHGFPHCNEMWVSRVMKTLNLTIKKVNYKKRRKYTVGNMRRTEVFLRWISAVPWYRLVFIDEARFESSDCMIRRGVAQRGVVLEAVDSTPIRESWTVTMCCRVGRQPIAIPAMHQGSNTAFDFGNSVIKLIRDGFLGAGDILVADNARIHSKPEMLDPLNELLAAVGARLVFQPTYSPEYNPCELVFSKAKNFLRHHRSHLPFRYEVLRAFSQVSRPDVFMFFTHCVPH